MPNIAAVLRQEIIRLARRQSRAENAGTRKASAQFRRHIAQLRQQVAALERQVVLLQRRALQRPLPPATPNSTKVRFVAKGLVSQRKRLGLSAFDYGRLVGVSPQSIRNWEQGLATPRVEQLRALVALRGIGKRDAVARLRQAGMKKGRAK